MKKIIALTLAVLMLCARYFLQKNIPGKTGILFVANSCEEGLGNLKGCRQIVADYGSRMTALATIDGACLEELVHVAVGSHRYQVTVKTEGGHSFQKFGNANAIAKLADMITKIYAIELPKKEGRRTTYNVGIVSGGGIVECPVAKGQECMVFADVKIPISKLFFRAREGLCCI